nr:MAG TPA: hypothetical protein [Caudoviricetes sp.]
MITDSEAYDILAITAVQTPGFNVGTVIVDNPSRVESGRFAASESVAVRIRNTSRPPTPTPTPPL